MKFTPTEWSSAEEKMWFFRRFMKFVEKGFRRSDFKRKFYNRLSMTFGHIAHYNLDGFWETFFTSTEGKVRFLEQTATWPAWGDPHYTYSDVEREIQSALVMSGVLETWRKALASEGELSERKLFERLKAKYEPVKS